MSSSGKGWSSAASERENPARTSTGGRPPAARLSEKSVRAVARQRLTDRVCSGTAAPAVGRLEIFDELVTGLAFRITEKGGRSWSILYRVAGELRRDTLGPYPRIGVARAREMARDALSVVAEGKDPRHRQRLQDAAAARRQADSVEVVAEQFIRSYAAQRKWRDLERIVRREAVAAWGDRPMADLTRRDVMAHVDAVALRAPVRANRVLAVFRIFFGWALERDIIQASPAERIRPPTREHARDRVLNDDEIRAFWKACEIVGWPFGPIGQLLLLTGQRRGEIAELRWIEVDKLEQLLAFSADRYKTGSPHVVPLSAPALAIIIEDLSNRARAHDSKGAHGHDFVFGSCRTCASKANAVRPVSGFSKASQILDRHMLTELQRILVDRGESPPAALADWRLHDLRRTVRTNLSKLRVDHDVAELVLGHRLAGVRATYDRYSYLAEKRQALELWAARLEAIVRGEIRDNIVALRR